MSTRSPLLEDVGPTILFPKLQRFAVQERFRINDDTQVPIWFLGSDFEANYLDLIERSIRPAVIQSRKLLVRCNDEPILEQLGGPDGVKIALGHVYHFLKTADRNGSYCFYAADKNGQVRPLRGRWMQPKVGWSILAYSCVETDSGEWLEGDQIIAPA